MTTITMPEYDERKLKELILYVADRCEADPTFGAIKLNKTLFYADFLAFASTGKPITGVEYEKMQLGPVPSALQQASAALISEGDLATQRKDRFGREQIRFVALRAPDLSLFTGAEIALVDEVIEALRGVNAAEVSDLSHLEHGWRLASLREPIPYETVFLSTEPVTDADRERVKELVAQNADW